MENNRQIGETNKETITMENNRTHTTTKALKQGTERNNTETRTYKRIDKQRNKLGDK